MFTYAPATSDDVPAIAAIYAQHVLHGTATFEIEPPDSAEMHARRARVADEGLPFDVARAGERVVGYAYASAYRARPAYQFTVEDSIYLDAAFYGRGIGRALLERVLRGCVAAGKRQMVAVIGDSANAGSIALHARLGFAHAGVLKDVGFKFGRFIDTVMMQKAL